MINSFAIIIFLFNCYANDIQFENNFRKITYHFYFLNALLTLLFNIFQILITIIIHINNFLILFLKAFILFQILIIEFIILTL